MLLTASIVVTWIVPDIVLTVSIQTGAATSRRIREAVNFTTELGFVFDGFVYIYFDADVRKLIKRFRRRNVVESSFRSTTRFGSSDQRRGVNRTDV